MGVGQFENARLCPERQDPDLNCYGVNASHPLPVWIYREDPRGWFQWYCHYPELFMKEDVFVAGVSSESLTSPVKLSLCTPRPPGAPKTCFGMAGRGSPAIISAVIG